MTDYEDWHDYWGFDDRDDDGDVPECDSLDDAPCASYFDARICGCFTGQTTSPCRDGVCVARLLDDLAYVVGRSSDEYLAARAAVDAGAGPFAADLLKDLLKGRSRPANIQRDPDPTDPDDPRFFGAQPPAPQGDGRAAAAPLLGEPSEETPATEPKPEKGGPTCAAD